MKKSMKLAIIIVLMLYIIPTCFADLVNVEPIKPAPNETKNNKTIPKNTQTNEPINVPKETKNNKTIPKNNKTTKENTQTDNPINVPKETNNMETVIIVGIGVLIIAIASVILIIKMNKKNKKD